MAKPSHHDESELMAEALSGMLNKEQPHKKPTYKIKKSIKITFGILVFGGLMIALLLFVFAQSKPSPVEAQLKMYKEGVPHQLYTPEKMPSGYVLDESKTTNAGGTIFTTFLDTKSVRPNIIVSQQAVPDGIGIESILGPTPPEPIDIPSGKLYLATTSEDNTAILVTKDSWIILVANKSLSVQTLQDLAAGLKPLAD